MLENWCFEEKVLQKISKHYQTGRNLLPSLRNKLIKAKKVGQVNN